LTKYYGPNVGVEELTFGANAGEVLGFLGPNGSGKTTTIRLLLGLLNPTSGSAAVLGFDSRRESVEIRRRVGYLPGDVALYMDRTGDELLDLSLRVRGLDDRKMAGRVVEAIGAKMDRTVKKLSRGMRQKVAIVIALAHDPELLIMDEPTAGLDPLAQRSLLQVLREEAARGKTVFFSSHVLSEAEELCDRVAILRNGRLAELDTIEGLRARKYKQVTLAYSGEAPNLDGIPELEMLWQRDHRLAFRARVAAKELLARLVECDVEDVTIAEPSLEDVFLDYYRGSDE
jgi:ABC-2 type transport system ATP-binding protein